MYDPVALRKAVDGIPGSVWSGASTFDLTGVHDGYRRVELIQTGQVYPDVQYIVDLFWFVLKDYAPIDKAWLSCISPGGFIVSHRDAGPWKERWHIPIQAAGLFNDVRSEDAVPFQVQHWLPHSVVNDTDHPRIHLVIDRDIRVGPDKVTGFEILGGM